MNKLTYILGISIALIGCDNPSAPTPATVDQTPPVSSPAITTTSLSIVAPKSVVHGTDANLAATMIDDSGRPTDVTHLVTWSSSNLLVLAVQDGKLFSIGPGTATVRATLGEVTTGVDVTIVAKEILALTINADSESATAGQTRTWGVTAQYNDNSVVDVSADAAWSSADPSIATVDAGGQVHAVAAGMTTIVASYGGQMAAAPFLVQSP